MLPWSIDFRGRFDEIVFESEVLKGNGLGDPHQRPLWVYLPPGYDDKPGGGIPPSISSKRLRASSTCGVTDHR
jgi:hypothetical protein